jgi:hypothetical protein
MGAVLAEPEEVSDDRRWGFAEQGSHRGCATGPNGERSELGAESATESFFGDGLASGVSGEEPTCVRAVVQGAALGVLGQHAQEPADGLGNEESGAAEVEGRLLVVVFDVVELDSDDPSERLAVEEDQQPSDSDAQLEAVVAREPGDERESLLVREEVTALLAARGWDRESWRISGLGGPGDEPADRVAGGGAIGKPAIEMLLLGGCQAELLLL